MSRMRLCKSIEFAVGPETVAAYERGDRVPTVDVAIKIARALGIRLKDLTDA
jgi:DNA-binding XRE family transcriptional regulator